MRIALIVVLWAGVAMGQATRPAGTIDFGAMMSAAAQQEIHRLQKENASMKSELAALRAELAKLKPPRLAAPAKSQAAAGVRTIRFGDIVVTATKVAVGPVRVKTGMGDARDTDNSYFVVYLTIANNSDGRKVTYRSWSGADFAFGRDYASLSDELGNTYKRVTFGIVSDVVGATKTASIYPGKQITDVLVFEPPIDKATKLTLELPGNNVGDSETVKIEIPLPLTAR
jgi:hypothetical protein